MVGEEVEGKGKSFVSCFAPGRHLHNVPQATAFHPNPLTSYL